MHQNKGKSIADCLADRTDYAENPDKTNGGELLSSYECAPKTVQGEFMLSKRQYDDFSEQQLTHNRRNLTDDEIADIESRCKQPCSLCE